MLRKFLLTAIFPLALAAPHVFGAAVSELLGQPITGLRGHNIGPVEELIVDVQEGRVLYILVQGTQQYYAVPIRGLYRLPGNGELRLSMEHEGEAAHIKPEADPRFHRAGRLLGQRVEHPGDGIVGTIRDIIFDPADGRIERVLVDTPQGDRSLPPGVLAGGHFPPVTQWQDEAPPAVGVR